MLDQATAGLIQQALPHCFSDVALLDNIRPSMNVASITYLEQAGFWASEKFLNWEYDARGYKVHIPRDNIGIVIKGPPGHKIHLNIAILSRAGRDLLKAVGADFDFQAMADTAFEKGAEGFFSGPALWSGDQVKVPFETVYTKRN